MSIRLPKADLNTKQYTDSQLFIAGQNIHDKMLANVAEFATPPISMAVLQTQLTSYKHTSAVAIKGSKADTANKVTERTALVNMLRSLGVYVTQLAQNAYGVNKDITSVVGIINLSGFKISKTPGITNARTGIKPPIIRSVYSKTPGTVNFILRNYIAGKRGKKVYQINYRTAEIPAVPPATVPTPAGPWQSYVLTQSNKAILTSLLSGKVYDYQIAALGGRDTKLNAVNPVNFTNIQQLVVT